MDILRSSRQVISYPLLFPCAFLFLPSVAVQPWTMELTPIANPRYRQQDSVRVNLQNTIIAFLAEQGVRVAANQLRTLQNSALDNLLGNLRAAANQGAVHLSNLFRTLTGRTPENLLEILGMASNRSHKWGGATQPPESFDIPRLKKRIENINNMVNTWIDKYANAKSSSAKKRIHAELQPRIQELERWKQYYRDQTGNNFDDLDRDNNTPQEEPGPIAQRRPAEDQLQAPPREYRPETPAQAIAEQQEEQEEIWADDQNIDLPAELFENDFNLDMAGTNTIAGASAGGPAMQQPVGRIKKNPPKFSNNGEQVVFSGSRQMYTWGYNFAEQVNPFSNALNTAYNAPSTSVVKPLGHTIPWDWIGFYCTPAEWESLNWGTHRIEIEEVGIKVTPADKSVFFTTGSTQTTAVSTEHAAYVFKYENFPQGAPLLRVQPTADSAVPINWSATNYLSPMQYSRMRDILWGPVARSQTGHSCMDGVKRELEPILGMLLDDASTYTTFGSSLHGEHKIVEPITEVMGRGPYIQKRYKPRVGLIHDPSVRVLHTQFSTQNVAGSAPYCQWSPFEDQLKEAALLLYKNPSLSTMNYKRDDGNTLFYTNADAVLSLYATRKDSDGVIGQDPIIYAVTVDDTAKITTEYSGTATYLDTPSGTAPGAGFYPVCGSASNLGTPRIVNGSAIAMHVQSTVGNDRVMYPALSSGNVGYSAAGTHYDNVAGGSAILGNPLPDSTNMPPKPQLSASAFNSSSTPKATYTSWTQAVSLDKDLDADYGDAGNTFTLSSWHAKIEKGNSFIPMGADRDCFPDVVPEQEPICFGLSAVIASDPNTGAVDFLKACVNWKIDYFMKIKQTFIPPQLRYAERRAYVTASRSGPTVLPYRSNYSHEIPSRGLEVSQSIVGAWTDGTTAKTVKADISDMNPLHRDLIVDGRVIRTIRTADVYHPEDSLSYPNSNQSVMTKTPATLGLQKLV